MITTIKPADILQQSAKYILLDDRNYNCRVIISEDTEEQKERELLGILEKELNHEYEISIIRGIPLEKEILFVWPEITEELKEKYPYVNGWLERARLSFKADKLLIETEANIACKSLNDARVKASLEKSIADVLGCKIAFEIRNGDFLEDISLDTVPVSHKAERKNSKAGKNNQCNKKTENEVIYGKKISSGRTHQLKEIEGEIDNIVVEAQVFDFEEVNTRKGNTFYTIDLTDYSNSITAKLFPRKELNGSIKKGSWVKIEGYVQYDKYSREMVLMVENINSIQEQSMNRTDDAEEKRIELHLHTKMSAMDSVVDIEKAIARAASWGHKAVAITDHGVVQAFPEAYWAGKKHNIKILYGIEAYMVDDGLNIIQNIDNDKDINDYTYLVFDLETTGLDNQRDEIIEIGAVKIKDGKIIDRYSSIVCPEQSIPLKITELTGISQEMVNDAPCITDIIDEFLDFAGDAVLTAHNVSFDYGFMRSILKRTGRPYPDNPVLDTLSLSRALYPGLKNHKLNTLCEKFGINLKNHHRSLDDAEATAELLLYMFKELKNKGISILREINKLGKNIDWKALFPYHLIIFARNKEGLKDLYRLVSSSHINHFYRIPRILKSELSQKRENLLIGSACESGQLYRSIIENREQEEIEKIVDFYDFLEIQPLGNNEFMLGSVLDSVEELKAINRRIYELGKKHGKPVVATGDVHFLDPEDSIYREILQAGQGYDESKQAPLYFRTTEEMLGEFDYFGETAARELVIENPAKIAELCEELEIIPQKLYTPTIEGAAEEIESMTQQKARELYGEPLPEIVWKRLDKELKSIIGNGYAEIYLTSHKLVKKSLEDGYLVGSRGSVGSSLVATMTEITEVNPLPPHYRCGVCKYSEFITDGSVGVGVDLPDKDCPQCGKKMIKDGFDIPFEVFLGFEGDKVPDIDLNFSSEYQSAIHKYTEKLFGKEHVFRAGTISSIADRTAYGFVKGYVDENNLNINNTEIKRLAMGCTGVKRTTGQHPGGQIVVPQDMEIYDFTPIQRPANDMNTDILTTHFDFNAIHDNLLKLDILGHDDPTTIRILEDLTNVSPFDIPLDDPETMAIFSGTESLGVSPEEIGTPVGTLGIPEFGTSFVRQMLVETRPTTFAELVRISGLSHGTDVWLNNAQDLIRSKTARLSEVISVRDDIMNYLIQKGLEPVRAFRIMENVRKGKGLTPEDEEYMLENNVPRWYIDSCKTIKYMFPKSHAAAYVMMAFRIAYYKVHYPEAFYAAYFTIKADDFDAQLICKQSYDELKRTKRDLEEKANEMTVKEKSILTVLEIVIEAMARGIKFRSVDLYNSDVRKFKITEKGLLPPLISLEGLGESAARNIVSARKDYEFSSIEDLVNKTRVSRNVIEIMKEHGMLKDLPEKNQLSLF